MATQAGIGSFLTKTLIVVFAVGGLLTYVDILAESRIESLRENIGTIGGRAFWSDFERKLDGLADPTSDLPAEKKQKILHNIKVLSDRWRPFVDAAIAAEPKPAQPAN